MKCYTSSSSRRELSKLSISLSLLCLNFLHSLALVLQKAERKWEEKRQNLDHYNGKEFEKLLEEAQANIMKSIPNLEMPPASGPHPKGDAPVDKPELSGKEPPCRAVWTGCTCARVASPTRAHVGQQDQPLTS